MQEIRCIAVDDEPLALEQIARYIGRIPSLRLVGSCLTVAQAEELLLKEEVDLMFLDIEMPLCSGVEFAERLAESHPSIAIIFTTAYPQYAVQGFRLDAVDYLLKPLSFEDMQSAVERVKRRIAATVQPASAASEEKDLFVRISGSTLKISIDDIVFIKGLSEYVQICLHSEQKLLTTHDSIKHFEEMLPADKFFRIHKSFLINLAYFESAESETLTVGGHKLPIGQKYRPAFKQYLKSL